MFIKNYEANILEDTTSIKKHCSLCDNEAEHFVYVDYYGPQIGLIFLSKPLLSLKKYYYVCSICSRANQELTKEQAYAHKKK